MPPMTKENETAVAPQDSPARQASPNDSAVKAQPVALEIPVTVNGARTVDGSDKREPFSETTQTVLVFGNGAVIRLNSSVAPGQLLFLTNEKTKKEVVCQVVKSKNYRNVSGYVELEFTELVVGFWGMRFPGDRIGPGPSPAMSAPSALGSSGANGTPGIPRPAAPNVAPPPSPSNITPKISETKTPAVPPVVRGPEPKISESKFVAPTAPPAPVVPSTPSSLTPVLAVNATPVRPSAPTVSPFDAPSTHESKASIFAPPPQAPPAPPTVNVTSLPADSEHKDSVAAVEEVKVTVPEVKAPAPSIFAAPPAPPAHVPAAHPPIASDPETEALKQHTARLQQQLSSMLFSDAPSEKPVESVPTVPVIEQPPAADASPKVVEMAHSETETISSTPVEVAKPATPAVKTSLDDEELKIPAWLEPLARNAAAPSSTQELIDREKAKRIAEQKPKPEESPVESFAASEEQILRELPAPPFGKEPSFGEELKLTTSSPKKSGKGMRIAAVAAGVVVLVGAGWWYLRPQLGVGGGPAGAAATNPQAALPASTVPAATEALQPQSPAKLAPQNNSAVTESIAPANPAQDSPAGSTPSLSNAVVRSGVDKNGASTSRKNPPVTVAALQPADPEPQPKKSSLGEVRLATPTVTRKENSNVNGDDDAGKALEEDQPETGGDGLGAGLGMGKQPAEPKAPVAVGGNVVPAKLVSSVPPIYPTLARNQHISGNVQVDALIDATGHVTTMKVISGPTLLHQAAMDALKQWKYEPAALDGKAVSMHLTVTIQFRMQ